MNARGLFNTHLGLSISIGLLVTVMAGAASAAPYTLEQKNFIGLGETAVMIRSEMQTVYSSTADALPFTGTFNASGWTLNITGSFAGQPVSYTATGVYNAGTQTTNYTGGGTVGSDTWAGDGFTSFFDVFTEIDLETHFKTTDTVKDTGGAKKGVPDRIDQTAKTWKTEGNERVGTGLYYKSVDGVIVEGPFMQTIRAPIGDGRASITIDDAFLTAAVSGGTVSGQLIPEPSGVALLLLAAAHLTRFKRTPRRAAGR